MSINNMAGVASVLPWNRVRPIAVGALVLAGGALLASQLLSGGVAIAVAGGLASGAVFLATMALRIVDRTYETYESLTALNDRLLCRELDGWPTEDRGDHDECFQLSPEGTVFCCSGSPRRTLPKCLGRFVDLVSLKLTCWRNLVSLPVEISGYTHLRDLNLQYCDSLASLPAELGQCTQLESLNLNCCRSLASIPAELGQCAHLRELNLSHCASLVSVPAELGQCTQLESLDLGLCTSLASIPAELGQCAQLQSLNLGGCNSVATLPAELGQCADLNELNLRGCTSLVSLPAEIGRCRRLKKLNLEGCTSLRGLPEAIFDLPSRCTIGITNSGLSDAVLARIRERVSQPGYNGPRFSYGMTHRNAPLEELSLVGGLEGALARVAQACEEALPAVVTGWLSGLSDGQEGLLRAWLHSLSLVGVSHEGGAKLLYRAVMKDLRHAATHADFHEPFFNNLEDATGSCGDRMSLSLLNLGVARRLCEISKRLPLDANEVISFLRGAFAVSELQGIAARKIPIMAMFDEIEVYLGYPIQLQHQLGIHDLLDVQDMLYFGCSGLTENDLDEAKNQVVQKWNQPNDRDHYLLSQPIYKELLRRFSSGEMETAEARVEEILATLAEKDPSSMSAEYAAARRIDLAGELNSVYLGLSNKFLATLNPESLAFPNVRT